METTFHSGVKDLQKKSAQVSTVVDVTPMASDPVQPTPTQHNPYTIPAKKWCSVRKFERAHNASVRGNGVGAARYLLGNTPHVCSTSPPPAPRSSRQFRRGIVRFLHCSFSGSGAMGVEEGVWSVMHKGSFFLAWGVLSV